MPTFTDPTISVPQTRDLGAPIPFTSAGATAANDLGSGLEAGIKAITQYRTAKAEGQLGAEQDKILAGVSAYNNRINQITSEMSVADPEAYGKLNAELMKIKNGETQGLLSPTNALLQYHAMARTYSVRYPFMAGNIRQYSAAFTGELSQILQIEQSTKDPILKGQEELLQRATKEGKTPDQIKMDDEARSQASDSVAFAQAAASRGELVQSQFDTAWQNGIVDTSSPIGDVVSKMRTVNANYVTSELLPKFVNGDLTKEQFLTTLYTLKTHMQQAFRSNMNQMVSDQAAAGKPVIFKDQENMYKHSTEPIDNIIELIGKTGDASDQALRLSNIAKTLRDNKANEAMYDVFHNLTPFLGNDPITATGHIIDAMRDWQHGLSGDYKAGAPLSGAMAVYAGMIGDAFPKFASMFSQGFAEKATGAQVSTPLPAPLAAAQDKAILQTFLSNHGDKQTANVFYNFISGTNPLTGIARQEAQFKPLLRADANAQRLVNQRIDERLQNLATNMAPEDAKDIVKKDGKWQYVGNKTSFPNLQLWDAYQQQEMPARLRHTDPKTGQEVVAYSPASVVYDKNADPRVLVQTLNEYDKIHSWYADMDKERPSMEQLWSDTLTNSYNQKYQSFNALADANAAKSKETYSFDAKNQQLLLGNKPVKNDLSGEEQLKAARQLEGSKSPTERLLAYHLLNEMKLPITNPPPAYQNEEEVQTAFTAGKLKVGDMYEVNGDYRVVSSGMNAGSFGFDKKK